MLVFHLTVSFDPTLPIWFPARCFVNDLGEACHYHALAGDWR